jgi:predicted secreted protein
MSAISALAVYFIIWWLCLFVVLPWGVRNPHESGETVAPGHDAGAPVNPMLWRKVAVTTVLASLIFAGVYGLITQDWIGFEDIPIVRDMPGT